MTKQLYTNNARSTLAADVDIGVTILTLTTGEGARFATITGTDWQMATITNADGSWLEIVKITARVGDVLMIEREQEGTSQFNWPTSSKIEARLTAGMLNRLIENVATTGLAIGTSIVTDAGHTVAIGVECAAIGEFSVAVGYGAKAYLAGGVALGSNSPRAYRAAQFASFTIPCIPRDDYWATYGAQYNSGQESTWASHYVDLGTPQTWAGSTAYTDGAVVRPTTPDGYQYRLWHGAFDSAVLNTVTTDATEPTWPAAIEGSVIVDGTSTHYWIGSDMSLGTDEVIPAGMVFYPTEVGFICFGHSGVSAAPFVSIGTVADPTLLVNNQQLSDITAASMRHAFTGLKHGITDLRCKLITPATGASARFHGRFYAKGIFIQTQG